MKKIGLAGIQARLAFDQEFASAIDEAFADKTRERNAALEERKRLRMEELELQTKELERLADEARKLRAERFKS